MWRNVLRVTKHGNYYTEIPLPWQMDRAYFMAQDFARRMPESEGFKFMFLQFDAMAKVKDFTNAEIADMDEPN